jgi:mono/diheme cytochrome c family protein
MNHIRATTAALTLAGYLVAFSHPAQAQPQDGLAVVQQHCATCHAIGKTGGSPHPAAPPFRRLGTMYDLDKLQEMLASGTVLPSHPDMPLFKLDGRAARAVTNYIRSIQE